MPLVDSAVAETRTAPEQKHFSCGEQDGAQEMVRLVLLPVLAGQASF